MSDNEVLHVVQKWKSTTFNKKEGLQITSYV